MRRHFLPEHFLPTPTRLTCCDVLDVDLLLRCPKTKCLQGNCLFIKCNDNDKRCFKLCENCTVVLQCFECTSFYSVFAASTSASRRRMLLRSVLVKSSTVSGQAERLHVKSCLLHYWGKWWGMSQQKRLICLYTPAKSHGTHKGHSSWPSLSLSIPKSGPFKPDLPTGAIGFAYAGSCILTESASASGKLFLVWTGCGVFLVEASSRNCSTTTAGKHI